MTDTLLQTEGLCKSYRIPGTGVRHPKYLHAVADVSLDIRRGETFGIVGESGCGKSTIARLLMGLEKPDAGTILLNGQRIDAMTESQRRPLRPRMQMVFQDSGSSLNPRRRIGDILLEPMRFHRVVPRAQEQARIDELLTQVGLPPEVKNRYPHEFSGGQRQRICIARALSLNPELLILDEPTSALDVSVQAQILNLLRALQQSLGLTYIFISHALSAVRYVSHRMAVMYMGRIVESGDVDAVFTAPVHPYTRALLDAAPIADVSLRDRPRLALTGEAGMHAVTEGCPFRGRCPMAREVCASTVPALAPVGPKHHAACILGGEGS